jgi:uncharacterized membrane protein affecting hemolysin expression
MDDTKTKFFKLAAVCVLCVALVSAIVYIIQIFGS